MIKILTSSLNWLMRIVCLMAALVNGSSGRYPLDDPKKDDAFTNGTYLYGNEMIYHFRFYIYIIIYHIAV